MKHLLKFKDSNFTEDISLHSKLDFLPVNDTEYLFFLRKGYSGFYFSKSLHLYGISKMAFHDLFSVNSLISEEYNFLADNSFFCFGCDLFGNQFCFTKEGISFFNLESCEHQIISKNFRGWLESLYNDTNYFTGESILNSWEEVMLPLKYEERLVPKKPFIIGGEYSPKNMRSEEFEKVIKYNASIAKQIYDLPDGTYIDFKTE